jgi:hypothetical protein
VLRKLLEGLGGESLIRKFWLLCEEHKVANANENKEDNKEATTKFHSTLMA